MADSIQRIISSSIPLDRAGQFGKERGRNVADGQKRRQDADEEHRVPEGQQATPANDDAKPVQSNIKGKNLNIKA
jgi:hypothetical protein